ncbi:MAG: hypothetical protein ACM3YM_04570 [Sphingomonadales bacterium]
MRALILAALALLAASPALSAPGAAAGRPPCDRACLEGYMKSYLDRLVAHDPSGLALAPNAKATENQQLVPIGDGLWKTAQAVGTYRIFASDMRNQQIAFIGNLRTTGGWTMVAIRLRILDNAISEVETIVPGAAAGEGTFNLSGGAASLKEARPAFATALTRDERRDRWQLIQAADLHYEGVERGNGDIVPFGNDCIKIENGIQLIRNPDFHSPGVSPSGRPVPNFTAMSCRDQFNTHIWDTDTITDRRYPVVDEERGIVVAFTMYNQYVKGPCAIVVDYGPVCPKEPVQPYSLALAEAFKVRGGFIEEVESVFTVLPVLRERGLW